MSRAGVAGWAKDGRHGLQWMGIRILDSQLISKGSPILRALGRVVEHEAVEANTKIIDETQRKYFGVACNRMLRPVERRPCERIFVS